MIESRSKEEIEEKISFMDLIKYLVRRRSVKYIDPEIDENLEIRYPVLDFIQSLVGEEVEELLQELSEKNILKKSIISKIVRCPNCRSLKLVSKYVCFRCGSDNIRHVYILTHIPCGFTGSSSDFKNIGGKMICPKCGKELKEEEYAIRGDIFICEDCRNTFAQPEVVYMCVKCKKEFTAKDAYYDDLYRYEVVVEELTKYEHIVVKDLIETVLKKYNYSLVGSKIKGLSGIEHEFLAVGIKEGRTVVIDFIREGEDVEMKLITTLGKAVDLPTAVDVLVLVPEQYALEKVRGAATNVKVLKYRYIDEIESIISEYL